MNIEPITPAFYQLMLTVDWSQPNKVLAEIFHVYPTTISRYRKFYYEHLQR